MTKLMFILPSLFLTSFSFAYESGEEFCKKNPVSFGRFHQIDKDNKVYSYTKKEFNPSLPTVFFFTGGPGGSPRSSEFDIQDHNVIFFEQRGMGCSRPQAPETFLNPDFYSSRNTIRDAVRVLKDYGVTKAIIYGHSYGTVLATMFGSLHPELTVKVILEGTIFKGDRGIWKSEIKRKFLQDVFDSLDSKYQEQILTYSRGGKIPASWFSVFGNMMSYLDNGSMLYKNFLENVLEMDEESFGNLVSSFYAPKGFKHISPLEANDGEVVFGMLTCKELSGNTDLSNSSLTFDASNTLAWEKGSNFSELYCDPLGVKDAGAIDLTAYPLRVPVVYLAGEFDGATDLAQARLHYKNVAKGKKELLMLEKGGHLPNLGALKDNRECRDEEDCASMKPLKTQVKMFEMILKGNLGAEELREINSSLELKWKKL